MVETGKGHGQESRQRGQCGGRVRVQRGRGGSHAVGAGQVREEEGTDQGAQTSPAATEITGAIPQQRLAMSTTGVKAGTATRSRRLFSRENKETVEEHQRQTKVC